MCDTDSRQQQFDEAILALFHELKSIAYRLFSRERPGHTLQPSILVNEAYIKLCRRSDIDPVNRTELLAASAVAMRRILLDHAEKKNAAKRTPPGQRFSLDGSEIGCSQTVDPLVFDEAIERLTALNARGAQVVTLRFFSGLTVREVAELLSISERTVYDEWEFAKVWLHRYLEE